MSRASTNGLAVYEALDEVVNGGDWKPYNGRWERRVAAKRRLAAAIQDVLRPAPVRDVPPTPAPWR